MPSSSILKFLHTTLLGADYKNNINVKDKLTEALHDRIDKIEERKLLEQLENIKIEKMSKEEREKYEKEKRFKTNPTYGSKKRTKSVEDEAREAHEAYQVILSEYRRRLKLRMKKKVNKMNMVRKLAEPMSGFKGQNVRVI